MATLLKQNRTLSVNVVRVFYKSKGEIEIKMQAELEVTAEVVPLAACDAQIVE
ncbi:hypothetical protein [Thiospirillum jenense]|uniref:Uncharacterized protein n=1 Tax=Thiospirillum jenense TaxID=1653858 RepID=A0A839HDU2_9GAMM|nr:hypothetical protein [Thiospirillum jenense]MBB1125418.1 hypothetical protein [Thiospirillum jenense]